MSEVLFLTIILGLLHPALTLLGMKIMDPLLDELQHAVCGQKKLVAPAGCVTFYLFTQSHQNGNGCLLNVGDVDNLNASPFNSDRETKVIIHGWRDHETSPGIIDIRKAYLGSGDFNVIVVNWYPLSKKAYPVCVQLVESVGQYIGEMLQFLNTKANLSYCDVHIIGHSLGAHIASFASATVSYAVSRITGLDPAAPCYEFPHLKNVAERLDLTDAEFVDVIHTSAGTIGFKQPIGHVDFYPNEGTAMQPGCFTKMNIGCSHGRSMEYMANSITYPHGFHARKCGSWDDYKANKCDNEDGEFMGEVCSPSIRGVYYLATTSKPPYCQN